MFQYIIGKMEVELFCQVSGKLVRQINLMNVQDFEREETILLMTEFVVWTSITYVKNHHYKVKQYIHKHIV